MASSTDLRPGLWLPAMSSLNCGINSKKSCRMKRADILSPPVNALILLRPHGGPSSVSTALTSRAPRRRARRRADQTRIRDSGPGVPPEVREKMFNPFFTTKPTGEGTGLGLSITHDIIVEQHSGSIDVETQPGEF